MITRNLLIFALAVFSTAIATAETATVFKMTGGGNATMQVAGSMTEITLSEGQEVPIGATVTVGADTQLFLRTFQGAVTTATAETTFVVDTVEKSGRSEVTRLTLKSGDLVANLDPAKRGIHDYGVNTPKGVAAARGTSYTVSVDGLDVLVTVVGGEVSFQIPDLPQPVTLTPGTASTGGASQTLAQAVSSNPAAAANIAKAMQAAATAVATLAADPNNTDGVTATTLNQVVTAAANTGDSSLTSVTAAAAVQADPNAANTVVAAVAVAAPTMTNDTIASVVNELEDSSPGSAYSNLQSLSSVATTANSAVTVDVQGIANAVVNAIVGQDVVDTPVEVEVPTDNIVISPSS